jgi:hypothetical protein
VSEGNEGNNSFVYPTSFTLSLNTGIGGDLGLNLLPTNPTDTRVLQSETSGPLTVNSQIINWSTSDAVTAPYSITWYAVGLPDGLACEQQVTFSTYNSFNLGTLSGDSILAGGSTLKSLNVNLRTVKNGANQLMPNRKNYCVWVDIDPGRTAHEGNELNNQVMISNSFYYNYVPVGVESVNGDSVKLAVYPNPTQDFITADVSSIWVTGNVDLSIADVSGKIVLKSNEAPKDHRVTVDVHGLAPGSYFMTIQNGTSQSTAKFIKY